MKHLLNRWEKIPVEEYPNRVAVRPMVSVCVQTYQHAGYIESCLEGILMQQTRFPFEVLVGEDASSDGTRDICLQYARKYPDKIRLFLHHRENNIQVNGRPTDHFNTLYNLFSARGKYIASCEGDDYWTEPFKLQRQVEFLEEHPEYGMISTDVRLIDEQGKPLENNSMVMEQRAFRKSEASFFDLMRFNLVNTLTVCIRSELMVKLAERVASQRLWYVYDHWFWLNIALRTRIKIFSEQTAAYRVHVNGMSREKDFLRSKRPRVKYDAIIHYLHKKNAREIRENARHISGVILLLLSNKYIAPDKKARLIFFLIRKPPLLYMVFRRVFNNLTSRSGKKAPGMAPAQDDFR